VAVDRDEHFDTVEMTISSDRNQKLQPDCIVIELTLQREVPGTLDEGPLNPDSIPWSKQMRSTTDERRARPNSTHVSICHLVTKLPTETGRLSRGVVTSGIVWRPPTKLFTFLAILPDEADNLGAGRRGQSCNLNPRVTKKCTHIRRYGVIRLPR
jgi:hypothetical protein